MQTFLPYPDFAECAGCLDRQRLGKQRVETLQIMRALTNPSAGWQSHPAVRMWRGCELGLLEYQFAICREWVINREYKDTCLLKTCILLAEHLGASKVDMLSRAGEGGIDMPSWLGNPAFHASHRSQLLLKDPIHYGQFGWTEEPGALEYIWPVP